MRKNSVFILLSAVITLLGFFVLFWLINNRGFLSLFETPLSTIGNISSNYLMFFLGSGIVFYFVILFFIKIYIANKIKVVWELYAFPVFILLTLIIPYNEGFFVSNILHTLAGFAAASIILFIMYKVNKICFPENKIIKAITHNVPKVTVLGTLALFFAFGINAFMQIFYLFMSILWINLTAFSISKEKKRKGLKK